MGALASLLRTTFLTAFRGGAGRVAGSTALKTEGAAIAEAWEGVTRAGSEKVVAQVAEQSGSFLGRAWKWIKGNPVKTTAGAGTTALGVEAYRWTKELGEKAKSILPFALIGGALAGGYLLLTGKDKKQEAPAAAPQALTPEEQLMQPQMAMPAVALPAAPAVAGAVTASYPAAVGTIAAQVRQESPGTSSRSRPERADTNWQARVGGPKAAPVIAVPHESHLAAEQARAEQIAAAQNGVA